MEKKGPPWGKGQSAVIVHQQKLHSMFLIEKFSKLSFFVEKNAQGAKRALFKRILCDGSHPGCEETFKINN